MLNRPEPALAHARRCLSICEEHGIGDFDIAFTHEAIARAYAVAGDAEETRSYVDLGTRAADHIEDEGNKGYSLTELNSIKEMLL